MNYPASQAVPCWLAGEPFPTEEDSLLLTKKDPYDEKTIISEAYCIKPEDVNRFVDSSSRAFMDWQWTSPQSRRTIFNKALKLLMDRKSEYIALALAETTANSDWAHTDHHLACSIIEETAAVATALRGEIPPSGPGQRAFIERVPYGVVFGIAPWNAPLTLGIRCFANAIMAGNTCIFKTSELSPRIHNFAAKLFIDSGLPKGVLNVVNVRPQDAADICARFIAHPAVRKVNFTGSTAVGSKIAEVCGRYLKPVVLELGGKAPVIILKDANLEAALKAVMFGGFTHMGQICMASDTLIVHESVAKNFMQLLSQAITSKEASARPNGNSGLYGLFTRASAERLSDIVSDALGKGANILIGRHSRDSNVLQPVIIGDVTDDMRISREELFGPVLAVRTFQSLQEAADMANSVEYGLAAAIFGNDERECYKIASEIESGQVHINGPTIMDHQTIPHGGMKRSGFGRFNGLEGLREFSQTKTITIDRL